MLVDGVDVRALLAVDLDVDEMAVHEFRDPGVLEAFVRHDMAPVACGITDRQKYGPIRRLGFGQRLGPPAVPVDGIVGMLEKIGAGLFAEAVAGHGRPPS